MRPKLTTFLTAMAVVNSAIAQPLFLVHKPACTEVIINVLAPDVFDSYHWDFGNGETAETRIPPTVEYPNVGNYTISLTVQSATPFRIVESIEVINYHPDLWDDDKIFCDDNKPDLFLAFTNLNDYIARTIEIEDAPLPSEYNLDGLLTMNVFPINAWDADGFWCGANDFLGSVTVPANSTGGAFSNPAYQLNLMVHTKLVNSATWSQFFYISDTLPDKPEISCVNDVLVSSYPSQNRWLDANQDEIPGAYAQAYNPVTEGYYYVKYTGGGCDVISEPVYFVPGSCIVTATDVPGEAQKPLKIYPNPTDGPLYIQFPASSIPLNTVCRLAGTDGRVVTDIPFTNAGKGILRVDLSGHEAGVWVIHIISPEGTYAHKVALLNAR
ncbi:MAG: hypothetical protein KDC61_00075 [Saprospiraceae bacterium]|nr:hypothetical protein [Saprospiraceae bacterium]MCB0542341.1 hypothetical protein [Saprospiraceae bacterium]MCB0572949.1 hypothetical protein [Saprospiraceae bacterium]MCB9304998.1 hypothetical protein [Lewinellaceae bacterium]MCB9353278.1 hypothetical protein [Lewinellaceae bacterium]